MQLLDNRITGVHLLIPCRTETHHRSRALIREIRVASHSDSSSNTRPKVESQIRHLNSSNRAKEQSHLNRNRLHLLCKLTLTRVNSSSRTEKQVVIIIRIPYKRKSTILEAMPQSKINPLHSQTRHRETCRFHRKFLLSKQMLGHKISNRFLSLLQL